MERQESSSAVWFFLLVVLLLHLFLAQVPLPKYQEASHPREAPNQKNEIEIAPLPDKEHPIVQSSKARDQAQDKNIKPKYSGEFKNRVEKETKSIAKGRFHEGHRLTSPEVPTSPEGERSRWPTMRDLLALGTTPNELAREIPDGNETVLNTDPVRFASFINRVADAIYDPWVDNAREAVKDIYTAGGKLEGNVYITKLDVEMDRDGKVVAITTVQSSGVGELDEASKKAFWDTEPFPNPPEGLFDKSGEVHFVYEFHFEWRTSSFSILPWNA